MRLAGLIFIVMLAGCTAPAAPCMIGFEISTYGEHSNGRQWGSIVTGGVQTTVQFNTTGECRAGS